MDNDRIFETGKAQAVIFIPKGFDDGTKPVEIEFDPVLDTGYKIAMRSLLTSLTVEVVMDIDNLEAVVSNFLVEKTKPNREFPSPLQQNVPGYAIFAMFFIAVPMSISFLKEKTMCSRANHKFKEKCLQYMDQGASVGPRIRTNFE